MSTPTGKGRFGRYPLPKSAYNALIAASVCVDADAETESSEGRVGAGTEAARAINRALALHRKAARIGAARKRKRVKPREPFDGKDWE